MKRICTIWLGLIASGQVFADYRGELSVDYSRGTASILESYSVPDYTPPPTGNPDPDPSVPPTAPSPTEFTSGEDDYSGWAVNGKYFLQAVDTSRGPLQLAEFLSRASSVGGSYGHLQTDDSNVETDVWNVFTRMVVGQSMVLEVRYGQTEIDSEIGSADIDAYTVAGGYYIAQNTQVRLGYDVEEQEFVEFERWLVDITHVQQLENGMTWQAQALLATVAGDADLGSNDDGSDLELAVKWFFNNNFGIGADYQMSKRDVSGDSNGYQLWASYFPTDKLSATLSYYDEENDDFDVDNDGVVFEAKYRF